jgi:uncharacterized membrane protein
MNKEFQPRGEQPGRLENLSDAVFALAITLLLISTSAPQNFDQLVRFTFELIPFVLCITWLIYIWYEHFLFYYRYGMRDRKIIVLNTLFLIVVLFFVYPLKFLTKLALFAISIPFGIDWLTKELIESVSGANMAALMIIYGVGVATVFLILSVMYQQAWINRDMLGLTEIERFDTRASRSGNLLMASIPILSVLLAIVFFDHPMVGAVAGFTYFLYSPVMMVFGIRTERSRNALIRQQESGSESVPEMVAADSESPPAEVMNSSSE